MEMMDSCPEFRIREIADADLWQ
jgi:hypothetical protein